VLLVHRHIEPLVQEMAASEAGRAGAYDGHSGFYHGLLPSLVVYPPFPPPYRALHYYLHLIGKKATTPPLGLPTIAA
ncbi:MAG: hypothetical protein ACREWG_11740, partial [Gammaproteobacteria bacterium]